MLFSFSLSLPFFLTVCLFSASSTWKCFFFLSFAAPPPKAFHVEAREEKLQAFNIQTSRALSLIGTRLPSKKPSGDDQPSFFSDAGAIFTCWACPGKKWRRTRWEVVSWAVDSLPVRMVHDSPLFVQHLFVDVCISLSSARPLPPAKKERKNQHIGLLYTTMRALVSVRSDPSGYLKAVCLWFPSGKLKVKKKKKNNKTLILTTLKQNKGKCWILWHCWTGGEQMPTMSSVRKGHHLVSRDGLASKVYAFFGCPWLPVLSFPYLCAPQKLQPMDVTGLAGWFVFISFNLRSFAMALDLNIPLCFVAVFVNRFSSHHLCFGIRSFLSLFVCM